MSDDQFTNLFKYLQQEFKAVRTEIGDVKISVDGLRSDIDAYAKQVLDLAQEHLMLPRKVDRIETWAQKIARQAGIKLDY